MRKTIFNLIVVFIVQRHLRTACAQNIRCQKVDFNRQSSVVGEFGECADAIPRNVLKINSYSDTSITPFRPKSEFHLTAVNGQSCLLSTSTFTLNSFSEIRTAIFLSWDAVVGSSVKVQIFDHHDGDEIDVIVHSEESNGWLAYYVKVNRTIDNAQIEISTNLNAGSMMAMEYLFVLNLELPNEEECVDEETDPIDTDPTDEPSITNPPTEPQPTTTDPTDDPFPSDAPTLGPTDNPTDLPTDDTTIDPTEFSTITSTEPTDPSDPSEPSTTVSNDEPTDGTTDKSENDISTTPTDSPTTSQSPRESKSAANIWMGFSILFFVTTFITLVGFCYFVWLYRRFITSMKPVTTSGRVMNTLPRLQVKGSVINGDSVIVGINTR